MNRRGFFGALSGLVAWAKKLVSVSPAASAVPPTCKVDPLDVASQRAVVGNANFFQAGQKLDVHGPEIGLPFRATVEVIAEDCWANTIHVSGDLSKVRAGDILMVHVPHAMFDIPYYNVGVGGPENMGIDRHA